MPRSEIASHKSSHLILLDGVCSVVERLGFFPKSRRGSRVCIQTAHPKRLTGGFEDYSPLPFGRGDRGEGAKLGAKYFLLRSCLPQHKRSKVGSLHSSPSPQ